MKAIGQRLLNAALQAATLVARFLFVFFIAKYLEPSDVGYYGLFTAAVGYSMYFVGLDFYTFATRELISTKKEERGTLLKSQVALSAFLYVAFLPAAYAIIVFFFSWPTYLLIWFTPILLLEHFNQEMSRLLVALSEQITATVILFFRQGVWALAAVVLISWHENGRRLDVVIMLWYFSGLIAALAAAYKIHALQFGGWKEVANWHWVRRGLASCITFMIGTLALRGIQTFDRYWLQEIAGIEIVGAYVLFLGVAGSLLAFLDAIVFSFSHPELIRMNNEKQHSALGKLARRMYLQTAAISVAFSIAAWHILPYLLHWINKPTYNLALDLFPWLLLATVLNAIGLVPHYVLYARGQDKSIVASHLSALIVFFSAVFFLRDISGALAVPQALVCAFFFILVWKHLAFHRSTRFYI